MPLSQWNIRFLMENPQVVFNGSGVVEGLCQQWIRFPWVSVQVLVLLRSYWFRFDDELGFIIEIFLSRWFLSVDGEVACVLPIHWLDYDMLNDFNGVAGKDLIR